MIAPSVEITGDSGDAAFGKPVPFYRRKAGCLTCRIMGMTDRSKILSVVGKMSERIARDDPHGAMQVASDAGLDVTGVYRLLAVLCTAAKDDPATATPAFDRYLREDEFSTLIRLSEGKPSPVSAEFGPGFVRLSLADDGLPESDWAVPILERMRGVTAEQGAGI